MKDWQFVVGVGAGFLIGISAVFFNDKPEIKPEDLFAAYQKGFKEALDAERPSERLEAVCAALWFKGGEK